MFGTILLGFYTLLLVYVLWRASSVEILRRSLPRKFLLLAGLFFWLLFFLGRFYGHHGTGPAAVALELSGMCLLGWALLTASALFGLDALSFFGLLFPKYRSRLRGAALLLGLLLTAVALFQGLRPPAVVSYEVFLPGLPRSLDGAVVAAVSDAHIGGIHGEAWFAERMAQVRDLHPKMVFFLGDIFEGHGNIPADIPALRELSPPFGKFFVTGNHEAHGGDGAGSELLISCGFTRLADAWTEPLPGLVLVGVNDLTTHRRRASGGDPLGRALEGRPPGVAILLSHTPWEVERAAEDGISLMLSGHTHGGQLWPFGLLTRQAYPFFAGRYEVDGMTLIVSRGMGFWGPPMRLRHSGEIVKLTLFALPEM